MNKNLSTQRRFVETLLQKYCQQNGLVGYKLIFDRRLTRLGACQWKNFRGNPEKWDITFYFSDKFLVILSDEEIEKTVIHEVAHAITPATEKPHGAVWRSNDIRMGGTGERCHDSTPEQDEAMAKYRGTCPNGHNKYMMRLTTKAKTVSCGKCHPTYNPDYRFTYVQLR